MIMGRQMISIIGFKQEPGPLGPACRGYVLRQLPERVFNPQFFTSKVANKVDAEYVIG